MGLEVSEAWIVPCLGYGQPTRVQPKWFAYSPSLGTLLDKMHSQNALTLEKGELFDGPSFTLFSAIQAAVQTQAGIKSPLATICGGLKGTENGGYIWQVKVLMEKPGKKQNTKCLNCGCSTSKEGVPVRAF